MNFFSAILFTFVALLSAVPFVVGHGYVRAVTIDGEKYDGMKPNTQGDSIVRNIDSSFPINDVNDLSTNCGINAKKATQVGKAKPGSTMEYDWAGGDDGNWPHNTGPMLTYIASCGDDCTTFDSQLANWLKIEEVGRVNPGDPWKQQDLYEGKTFSFKLPSDLPNGNYLVRHEVIGLHIASNPKGVEMYPSCTQISVTGGSDGALPSGTVKFPGAYKQDDPGLLIRNQFDSRATYPFPGPKVTTSFSSGGSNNGNSNDENSNNDSNDTTTETATPTGNSDNNNNDGGAVTVTETQTVTVNPARGTSTVVTVETVTAAADSTTSHDYRIRRSRIWIKRSGH